MKAQSRQLVWYFQSPQLFLPTQKSPAERIEILSNPGHPKGNRRQKSAQPSAVQYSFGFKAEIQTFK